MVKTVFMTGASGIMGHQSLIELLTLGDKVRLKLLVLKSDNVFINKYKNYPNIEIIVGNLINYEDVLKGVTGSDYVLHIGGMVSPACDEKPRLTRLINVTGAENIVKAVLAQKNKDEIKVCYIGSVAELGDRMYPIHWGRTGDPIKVSVYDHYAVSKVMAEKLFVESGIKHWVVLRQSGILYPDILFNLKPIIYNVCINGVIEWATYEDSGRLMKNFVDSDLPDEFWNKFYNISSGPNYRLSYNEFEQKIFDALGFGDSHDYFKPNWFISRNFHGHFYSDSDILENYLHFRENLPFDDYMNRLVQKSRIIFRLFKKFPFKKVVAIFVKPYFRLIANTPYLGTLNWIKKRDQKKISAYYGSLEEYEKIPSTWENYKIRQFDKDVSDAKNYKLSHGYDETKKLSEISLEDCQSAAKFRGGELLSKSMIKGDLSTKLEWQCGYCKEVFKASPCLILLGGHWCPECYTPKDKWDYDGIAKTNKFFAQVYYNNHRKDENNVYYFDEIFSGKIYDEKEDFFKHYMIKNITIYFISFLVICLAAVLYIKYFYHFNHH